LYTVLFSIKLSSYFAPANASTQASVALIYAYNGQLLLRAYCRDYIMFLTVRLYCDTLCDAYHWVNYASVCYIFVGKDNLQHASLIAAMLDVKYVYIATVAWQLCCVGFLPRVVVSFRCSDSSRAW